MSAAKAADTDIKLGTITTVDGQTYSNAVVFSKNATHVSISHAGGMANVKAKHLDIPTQRKLGYIAAEEPKTSMPSLVTAHSDPRLREMEERLEKNVEEFLQQVDRKTLYQLLTLIGILYLFFCYCCVQICRKTSNRPGLLVWVPGFQMIPLLRAAGMPSWLFILLFVPVVGVIVGIVWCFRICRVRQKNAFWAILLLLPVTSPIAFVYLALSGYGPPGEYEGEGGKIKLGYQST